MPSESTYSPKQNRILGSLPTNDYSRLQDDLDLVHLELAQVLYESGDSFGYSREGGEIGRVWGR